MQRVSGAVDETGYLVALGQAIRTLRKELGLSQEMLAHAAQIDRSHMGKIERGERNVTILNIVRICAALGCSASQLMSHAEGALPLATHPKDRHL
ncbi:helix-turn-helix domain-containing protein [Burkholderia pseudomallei]|uniref:helix-turn-helix domain-containing protein n=2 Tax=Burkholderia pseudomallei TaxID=28450 RepID=UPI0005319447|nr:helix-turn-helix transcriptional regulator [Burkholderia pseudomallei]OXH81586.1 transcriptional regulator [Burkholderia multivorans]KGS60303.1 helix-turn-helix family protein [Burkholderia pseudomallei MSHR4868]KGX23960.1 C.AhdI domain protein [Burkholderia pseudomallei]KGX30061.1 C.AhdI domain protein [Burkholderia pseudomallei]MBY7655917.1 helix-turn-helix transcriptional regulator [Burkholderia pseudomallei]